MNGEAGASQQQNCSTIGRHCITWVMKGEAENEYNCKKMQLFPQFPSLTALITFDVETLFCLPRCVVVTLGCDVTLVFEDGTWDEAGNETTKETTAITAKCVFPLLLTPPRFFESSVTLVSLLFLECCFQERARRFFQDDSKNFFEEKSNKSSLSQRTLDLFSCSSISQNVLRESTLFLSSWSAVLSLLFQKFESWNFWNSCLYRVSIVSSS